MSLLGVSVSPAELSGRAAKVRAIRMTLVIYIPCDLLVAANIEVFVSILESAQTYINIKENFDI